MKTSRIYYFLLIAIAFVSFNPAKATDWNTVSKTFLQAPDSTRTRVWWFWGEAVVTREGIHADLEAMKKAGLGGVVVYEQLFGNRTDAIQTLTPQWFDLVAYAGEECARLGLQFDITISSGYCAGGPWITPDLSMKRLVSKEYAIAGKQHYKARLALDTLPGSYYKDAVLIAYKQPSSLQKQSNKAVVSSNNASVVADKLFVTDGKTLVKIPPLASSSPTYIQIVYPEPVEIRSISYSVLPVGKMLGVSMQLAGKSTDEENALGFKRLSPFGQLEASEDGVHYGKVTDLLPIYRSHEGWRALTRSFKVVRSRFFRLHLYNSSELSLGNVVLNSDAKVDQWELKAANRSEMIIPDYTPAYGADEALDKFTYVDLSSKISADGVLDWKVPAGDWKIFRMGYVSTNTKNKHGRPEATGLECDKLSINGIDVQFQNYPLRILNALKDHTAVKVSHIHIDSAEQGDQNWSDGFIAEFRKRRGYDPTPYLPAMKGYIVKSADVSERFLHDVRRTIADLIADNYFGHLNDLAHQHGLKFTAQAPGNALCIHADPIQCKSRVDVPQGEFWVNSPNANYDVKEASSAAHLYNKPIASGEAFTGAGFKSYPDFFKSFADGAYAMGINEFVICASTHQPWTDKKPGSLTIRTADMFQRNNTWWDYSRDFWDYQSRLSYMMRTGKATVDYCYYLGEQIPVKILSAQLKPAPPSGYDFDVCTPEALLQRFSASKGLITLPDGAGYKLLVLPDTTRMSLPIARKLKELVGKGACILGRFPTASHTLLDLGKGDAEVQQIARELWGDQKEMPSGVHAFGDGKVYWGKTIQEVLADIGLPADVSNGTDFKESDILFTHRRVGDEHIYFVSNHKDQAEKSDFTFRVGGMQPELWNPETGQTKLLPEYTTDGKVTRIPLQFYPQQSYLIVFRKQTETIRSEAKNFPKLIPVVQLTGNWTVHFDPKWGGPETVVFDSLIDWRRHPQPGIKYYSGTARYVKSFFCSKEKDKHYTLDLGKVANIARVKLNGRLLGNVWCKPWQIDITASLQHGNNLLEIEVANQWVNRLVGDASLPDAAKVAFTTYNPFTPDSSLTESGLLGNVQILMAE